MAIVLTVFTLMGLLPGFRTTFGLLPLYGNDIWFHAIEAASRAIVGFVLLRPEQTRPKRHARELHRWHEE